MQVDNWDEIRTAYHVARLGTVSGAAEVLGVHHATVIRHIDALEGRLGAKLFQRHPRGYTATEAGIDLLKVAQTTDDQFSQLAGRIRGRGEAVTGELIVTTLNAVAPLILPSVVRFQEDHPDLTVRILTGERLFRLEYGEAHVAIRAGNSPQEPDNIAQSLGKQLVSLYASKAYVAAHGMLKGEGDFKGHRFVSQDNEDSRAPFDRWIRENIPAEQITLRASEQSVLQDAIHAGAGIGFMAQAAARTHPELVPLIAARDEWAAPLWLVTHVDLHRTMKVQTFTTFLKEEARNWNSA
jgi:DNA-binding transcriptional LysR family regulator